MAGESEVHYYYRPTGPVDGARAVEFVPAAEFLADEPACRALWDLITAQFRTRGKFLAVWPCVRFVAVHRDPAGQPEGFLLVSAPINWQIDYVVVRPESRGRGVAAALVRAALDQAHRRGVPYVMLSARPALAPLYEGCGFRPVATPGH